jgi:hypothetical protein
MGGFTEVAAWLAGCLANGEELAGSVAYYRWEQGWGSAGCMSDLAAGVQGVLSCSSGGLRYAWVGVEGGEVGAGRQRAADAVLVSSRCEAFWAAGARTACRGPCGVRCTTYGGSGWRLSARGRSTTSRAAAAICPAHHTHVMTHCRLLPCLACPPLQAGLQGPSRLPCAAFVCPPLHSQAPQPGQPGQLVAWRCCKQSLWSDLHGNERPWLLLPTALHTLAAIGLGSPDTHIDSCCTARRLCCREDLALVKGSRTS